MLALFVPLSAIVPLIGGHTEPIGIFLAAGAWFQFLTLISLGLLAAALTAPDVARHVRLRVAVPLMAVGMAGGMFLPDVDDLSLGRRVIEGERAARFEQWLQPGRVVGDPEAVVARLDDWYLQSMAAVGEGPAKAALNQAGLREDGERQFWAWVEGAELVVVFFGHPQEYRAALDL